MIVRSSLIVLLALLLIGVIAVGIVASPAGNKYLVRRAELFLAPALEVQGVSGSILGSLCAQAATYRHERVTVTAREICVNPRLWESLDYLKVSLATVTAQFVEIRTSEAEATEKEGTGFQSPVIVEVSSARIADLVINGTGFADVEAAGELLSDGVLSESSFTFSDRHIRLATAGTWQAFRADVQSGTISVTATVDLTDATLPFEIDARAQRLDLDEFGLRPVSFTDVTLTGQGSLAGYGFSASGTVSDKLGSAGFEGTASGDWDGLTVTRAVLRRGELPSLGVEVEQLTTSAAVDWAQALTVELGATEAHGSFRGWQLDAALARARLDGDGVTLADGVLRTGATADDAELRVAGTVTAGGLLALELSAERVALDELDPRFAGRASAELKISGNLDLPRVNGRYAVLEPGFRAYRAGSLSGEFDGAADAGQLRIAVEDPRGDLEAALSYRRAGAGIELGLESALLNVNDSPAGPLRASLDSPATIEIAGEHIEVGDACVTLQATATEGLEDAALCGAGSYPEGPMQVRLAPWTLPELGFAGARLALTGSASGNVVVEDFEPLTGTASIDLVDLTAHHPGASPLALGRVELTAEASADKAIARVASEPDQGLLLDGELTALLGSPLEDSTLDGYLALELDAIWAAETLLPMDLAYELDAMRGVLALDAQVAGTLADPLLDGRLLIRDAGWDVLALNASFRDVQLEAQLAESERLTFDSHATLGEGSLALSGALEGLAGEDPRLTTTLTLDGAEVVDLPDYSAVVAGELELRMNQRRLDLNGDLRFPKAQIRIAELPQSAVSVSEDEVLVGEDEEVALQQIRSTNLRITLGDRVRLEAFGLTCRLVGSLTLKEAPGRPREVTGAISVRDGVFEAYGQKLTVERGQLNFIGPLDDPAVDVVASRVVSYEDRDYRISLHITGTANALNTTVTSSPTLAEDDALALLITGRTFSQISSSEQTNVYGAAISLGLFGASKVTQNVASRVGLEEIILDQDAEGNMEVGAALRLSSHVYLRYTYGVFSRLGGVLLRYRLNNRFSVQAKTGDAHSIELRYGVDD